MTTRKFVLDSTIKRRHSVARA